MNREKETAVVTFMIEGYCRGKHGGKSVGLCGECAELLEYAKAREENCPFGDGKPFCVNCKVHCYKPDMREKIRAVMRYSGPRLIFTHPLIAFRHLAETKREKRKQNKL